MRFSFPNINKEGYLFIVISFVLTCIAFSISWSFGITCLFPTLLCIYFFRDPARVVPSNKDLILSPADGVISKIEEVIYPSFLSVRDGEDNGRKLILISIFLSMFDVHVNRIPISGMVKEMHYKKGKFVSAMNSNSSNENEKQVIIFEYGVGKEIIVEQVAGIIARRIVCNLKVSQDVKAGERFGIIRFGSRVNVYIPLDVQIMVSEGQTVIGGETIIANLNNDNSVREKPTFNLI